MNAVLDAATTGNTVLSFYRKLAFNQHSSVRNQIKQIKSHNPVANYEVLEPLLGNNVSVLEVGSGTGWLSNSMSYYYGADVQGIDFNADAVEFSQKVARKMRSTTRFEAANLFEFSPAQPVDLVVSLGVMHHTGDCMGALTRACSEFVAPGGHIFVGLYHLHGRKPFLDHFTDMANAGASEQAMLERYQELHSALTDKKQILSWFRDQVLHPHETQHTLAEVLPVLESAGCDLISTSINDFQPIKAAGGIDAVLNMESALAEVGEQRLAQNNYYPGFYLFLAKKRND